MKKVPSLRFPGFEGEWRCQKLSQISQKVTNKNINCQCQLVLSNSRKGLIAQPNSNKTNLSKYLVIKKYDFCYDPTPTKNYPYGPINQLEKYDEGVVSPIYICFHLIQHQNLDSNFFKYFFQTNKWYHHIYLVGNKGVRKIIGIKSDDFFKMLLFFPDTHTHTHTHTQLSEQTKISDFLTLIDRKIELLTKIIDCFIKIKKYLLNNLFVNKNNKTPLIRFPQFHGEWQQFQVKDVFRITRGKVLATSLIQPTKNDDYQYPVYSSQVLNHGILGYYHQYLFENVITWTTDGYAGIVSYRAGKCYPTNVCGVLISEKYNNQCVATCLSLVTKKYVSKSCIPKLMNNIMSKIKFWMPNNLSEQTKISEFLTLINQKIENIQQQKEKIIQIKKYLLNKMFVND